MRSQLVRFYAHVAKLPKVLIKGGDWHVPSRGSGGDHTVDKMNLRSRVAIQCVEVNCYLDDFNARTGDKTPEHRGNVSARVPVERLEYKYTFGQNHRQHHKDQVPAIAGIE